MLGFRLIVFGALLCAFQALGYSVIVYDLDIYPEGHVFQPNDPPTHTAIVILGDYYTHNFGLQDGLAALAARGHGKALKRGAVRSYLKYPKEWYLAQMKDREEIYGKGDLDGLIKKLRNLSPMDLAHSSMVILTEYGNLKNPLGTLRFDATDAEGLLGFEQDFKEELDKKKIEPVIAGSGYTRLRDFSPEGFDDNLFILESDASDLVHEWPTGGRLAASMFGLDEDQFDLLFPPMIEIARVHRMTRYSADGNLHKGTLASQIYWGSFGKVLHRFYHHLVGGVKVGPVIKNENTFGFPLSFSRVTPDEFEDNISSYFEKRSSSGHKRGVYRRLYYNEELTRLFQEIRCDSELAFQQTVEK